MAATAAHAGAVALALLAVLSPRVGAAGCTSPESCLRAVDAARRGTTTLTATFVQQKHVSLLAEPIESRGRFTFKRPDRIRIQVDEPQTATVVINGATIEIPGISSADREALALTPVGAMFRQLGGVFSGAVDELRKDFAVHATRPADGGVEIELRPRAATAQQLVRRIVVRFAGPELTVTTLRMDDELGDWLEITLSDVQRNQPVDDALFAAASPSRP